MHPRLNAKVVRSILLNTIHIPSALERLCISIVHSGQCTEQTWNQENTDKAFYWIKTTQGRFFWNDVYRPGVASPVLNEDWNEYAPSS